MGSCLTVGVWVGANQLNSPAGWYPKLEKMRVDYVDIMCGDVGNTGKLYDLGRVKEFAGECQRRGMGARLTVWADPGQTGNGVKVAKLATDLDAGLTLDVEEPWTKKAEEGDARKYIRRIWEAYHGDVVASTIVYTPARAWEMVQFCDVWSPQCYAEDPTKYPTNHIKKCVDDLAKVAQPPRLEIGLMRAKNQTAVYNAARKAGAKNVTWWHANQLAGRVLGERPTSEDLCNA